MGVAALLILCAMAAVTAPAGAQAPSASEVEEVPLHLNKGEARLEAVAEPFDTVVVGDPAVVTTSVVSATALVLTAGSTWAHEHHASRLRWYCPGEVECTRR